MFFVAIESITGGSSFSGSDHRDRNVKMDSRGFTLLELIVVCVLIGIMLVVSVPTLRDAFVDDPLKATSRKVIGFVNGVRELAAREQQSYFLYFNTTEPRIWYEKDIDSGVEGEKQEQQELNFPADVRISEIWTQTAGMLSTEENMIWVSPKGYMDQTILHLTDETRVISLHFLPFLESVKIYDKYTPAP